MSTTVPRNVDALLDALKLRYGSPSDYHMAKRFGLDIQVISNYRKKRTVPDDVTAVRMAKEIGVPPGQILAMLHAERAAKGKNPNLAQVWHEMAEKLGVVVLAALAVLAVQAAPGLFGEFFASDQALMLAALTTQNIHYAQYGLILPLIWVIVWIMSHRNATPG